MTNDPKDKRAGIYARVSTQDQRPEIQLEALRRHAEARGWTVALEAVDHGISGRKDRRPGLQQLEEAARRRDVDVVVVTKLDRLARSVHHLTQLSKEFEALRVDLVVVDQGLDTSTPTGRLLFHLIASIAEFEGELIRERTKAGLAAARRRGVRLGRKPLDIKTRNRIQRLRRSGRTIRGIAELVGVAKSTVEKVLKASG